MIGKVVCGSFRSAFTELGRKETEGGLDTKAGSEGTRERGAKGSREHGSEGKVTIETGTVFRAGIWVGAIPPFRDKAAEGWGNNFLG